MLVLMALAALVLFVAFAGIFVVGMFVKGVLWLVFLPVRLLFGLLFTPLWFIARLVFGILGAVFSVLMIPVVLVILAVAGVIAVLAAAVPLLPLICIAFVVWVVLRASRPAVA